MKPNISSSIPKMIYKNLFSQRKKKQEGKVDFYEYDEISEEIRRKVFYTFDRNGVHPSADYLKWDDLKKSICHQYGIVNINRIEDSFKSIHEYMINCDLEKFLDCIQIFLYDQSQLSRFDKWGSNNPVLAVRNTIRDINDIFQMDGIGYEVIQKGSEFLIVRADSKYLHEEVVKNALTLLDDEKFKSPLHEFEKAIENYTRKNYPEAITWANSAFESVMKVILDIDSGDATQLIKGIINLKIKGKPFIPSYYSNFGVQVKNLLQCLPVKRNEEGMPHGKGKRKKEIDKSYAEFALHLCGSFIVFLIQRYKELR